jgi:hypothetical protein
MKRVISAALSVIMLLCMMASCANNSQETTSSGQSVESTDLESGDKLVIDDTKLDGYEYTVLVSGNIDYNKDYGSDFYFEEEGADNIDSARQKWIYETEKERVKNGEIETLKCDTGVEMIDFDRRKFVPVFEAVLTLDKDKFTLLDESNPENEPIEVPIATFASLPFKPGKYIEIQKGPDIYRLTLEKGAEAMKYVNVVKSFYEVNSKLAKPRVRL